MSIIYPVAISCQYWGSISLTATLALKFSVLDDKHLHQHFVYDSVDIYQSTLLHHSCAKLLTGLNLQHPGFASQEGLLLGTTNVQSAVLLKVRKLQRFLLAKFARYIYFCSKVSNMHPETFQYLNFQFLLLHLCQFCNVYKNPMFNVLGSNWILL